jgi:hypothetical protein
VLSCKRAQDVIRPEPIRNAMCLRVGQLVLIYYVAAGVEGLTRCVRRLESTLPGMPIY